MSVKMILDDAAAEATAGLRIDLVAVRRQADQRRSLVRRRASAAMAAAIAVAAVAALVAVLLPSTVFRASNPEPAAPTDASTGLPDRWYYAPPWTPPVTRHPMAAASMMLAMPLQQGWSSWRHDGPVLVSADGTEYASVPWGRWDGLAALSPSGRDIGWVTQTDSATSGPEFPVIHRIRLADGRQRDAELPKGARVERLLWDGDKLIIGAPAGAATKGWSMAAGATEAWPVPELPAAFAEPRALGHVYEGDDPEHPGGDAIASTFQVHDPEGQRVVETITGRDTLDPGTAAERPSIDLSVSAGGGEPAREIRVTASDPVMDAQVLGWAEAGIVVRIHSREPKYGNQGVSLRIFPADGSPSRIASKRVATLDYPVAVAVGVVGSGNVVVGDPPDFPVRDRAHLKYLVFQAWSAWGGYLQAGLALVLLLVVGAVLRRWRRRADPGPTDREPSDRGPSGEGAPGEAAPA
jgi:hypothetical protein